MTGYMFRLLSLSAVIALMVALRPVRASDEVERQIRALAEAVHRENVGSGNYTEWVGGKLGKRPESLPQSIVAGSAMPDFTLQKIGTKTSVKSAGLKGPYLLNIWASWCPPCRAEFPLLTRASLAGDLSFTIYFVNTSDTQRRATNFLKGQRSGIQVLYDAAPTYEFNRLIGIQAIPDSVLVDDKGQIAAVHVGEVTPTTLTFLDAISRHPGVSSYAPEGALPPVKPFKTDSPLPLVSGVQYAGTLDDGLPYVTYQFSAQEGETITISMRMTGNIFDENTVDPYLVLLDSSGAVIAYDDDSGAFSSAVADRLGNDLAGSSVDALIKEFTIPATGTYTVIVSRAGYEAGRNSGTYQLLFVNDAAFF